MKVLDIASLTELALPVLARFALHWGVAAKMTTTAYVTFTFHSFSLPTRFLVCPASMMYATKVTRKYSMFCFFTASTNSTISPSTPCSSNNDCAYMDADGKPQTSCANKKYGGVGGGGELGVGGGVGVGELGVGSGHNCFTN